MDIKTMTVAQLEKAKAEIEDRLASLAAIEDTKKEIENLLKSKGLQMSDITGGASKKVSSVAPKYRHPENPSLTWAGRGRKPAWLEEALSAGRSLEDFAI